MNSIIIALTAFSFVSLAVGKPADGVLDSLGNAASNVGNSIGDAASDAGNAVGTGVSNAAGAAADASKDAANAVGDAAGDAVDTVSDAASSAAGAVSSAVTAAFDKTKDFFSKSVSSVDDLVGSTKEGVSANVDKTVAYLEGVKSNKDKYMATADENGKKALANIDTHIASVKAYKNELADDTSSTVAQTTSGWKTKVQSMWTDMQQYTKMVIANGAPMLSSAIFITSTLLALTMIV